MRAASSHLSSTSRLFAAGVAAAGAATAATTVACVVNLPLPGGEATVVCGSDDDCVPGMTCAEAVAACVDEQRRESDGPRLQSASGVEEGEVRLVFDEAVVLPGGAVVVAEITPALAITDVELDPEDPAQVILTTDKQAAGLAYEVEVLALSDIFGNELATDAAVGGFVGFGTPPDAAPPRYLVPEDGVQVRPGELRVAWLGLAGAELYTLEVWTDGTFADTARRIEVVTPEPPNTEATVELVEPTTHWLRLRGNFTRQGEWAVLRVEVVGDTLFVHCPAGGPCDDGSTGGNLQNPRRSLALGLADARRLGVDRVLVAARGGAEAYEESIEVFAPLTLRGGYDATFDETAWSPTQNPTIIRATGEAALRGDGLRGQRDGAVTLEGLELVADGPTAAAAVSLIDCDDGVELRGCTVRNETEAAGGGTGVYVQGFTPSGAPGPRLTDNRIIGGSGNVGVFVLGVDVEVRGNVITVGGTIGGIAIVVNGGDAVVADNEISLPSADAADNVGVLVSVLRPFSSVARVEGNVITAGPAPAGSLGVVIVNSSAAVDDNVISTGAAHFTAGVHFESGEIAGRTLQWSAADNLLTVGVGVGEGTYAAGIFLSDRADPANVLLERNHAVVAGLAATGGENGAAGVFMDIPSTSPMALQAANNVLDVGPATGAGILLTAGVFASVTTTQPCYQAWIHNTVRFPAGGFGGLVTRGSGAQNLTVAVINNLIVGAGAGGGGGMGAAFMFLDEPSTTVILDHNLTVGTTGFISAPGALSPLFFATGTAANGLTGGGNLGLESAALNDASDLALGGADGLQPTAASPAALRFGGIDATTSTCGGSGALPCGGVGDDFTGATRSCPDAATACTSIGAYEVD